MFMRVKTRTPPHLCQLTLGCSNHKVRDVAPWQPALHERAQPRAASPAARGPEPKPNGEDKPMTVDDRDALDDAITELRALSMSIHGAESIMDQDEANTLQALAAEALRAFEALKVAITREPVVRAA